MTGKGPAAGADRTRGALVVGGAHGALAVVRSLGRHGIPVGFATHDHPIAGFSRYAEFKATWAGPDHPDAAGDLAALARQHGLGGWVLIPGGDSEVRLISQNHAFLSSVFRLTTPPWETARWALDKRLTYERAAALGIACPWSHYPRDRQGVAALDCGFPVILKPTTRVQSNAFTRAKAWRVDSKAELLARFDEAVALVGTNGMVLQEMIPGDGSVQFSYAAVCDGGAPVASLVARRTRQYPIDFGYTSTFVETVENRAVEAAGARFLRSLAYTGMAEVEFKLDRRNGQYKLLDVNLRPWTWNALGRIAGVDFAHVLWRTVMGESLPPSRGSAGATWTHFDRDLVAAVQQMRRGSLSLRDYLASFHRPVTFAASAADDPLPGLLDAPLLLKRFVTGRLPVMAGKLFRR